MRLDDIRESDYVEDRRGQGGLGGGGVGIPIGRGGGLGFGTMIVLGLISYALGIDPRILIGGAEVVSNMGGSRQTQQSQPAGPPPNDETGKFLRRIMALNEDVWTKILPDQGGVQFKPPTLVIFSRATRSGCGGAQAAMGPFYCPVDQKLYLDTSFFDEMKRQLGGGGQFAYAYVVGHEVGHHIQNQLGLLPKVQNAQRSMSQAQGNALQVRVELQADCYAGVWAHHADQAYRVIQPGDVDQAINTAAAIGDDKLQQQSQGYVVPESFTHGSSEQRKQWFMQGLKNGTLAACDTFKRSAS
ncbi:KPN_02809 family neutral zinc metallopeptidase [Terrarubrum flagellatum]|uniref:KPN_02809 family neutral zinc metallopeptidase n=1 Tax=Terrirubrum flagellatum TaxID=2895980 RepID=UPI0031455DFD